MKGINTIEKYSTSCSSEWVPVVNGKCHLRNAKFSRLVCAKEEEANLMHVMQMKVDLSSIQVAKKDLLNNNCGKVPALTRMVHTCVYNRTSIF